MLSFRSDQLLRICLQLLVFCARDNLTVLLLFTCYMKGLSQNFCMLFIDRKACFKSKGNFCACGEMADSSKEIGYGVKSLTPLGKIINF